MSSAATLYAVSTPTEFSQQLLAAIGAPATQQNIDLMNAWQQVEAQWAASGPFNAINQRNPLNIQSVPAGYQGSAPQRLTDSAGKSTLSFGSWQDGINATAAFMQQNDPRVVQALQSGNTQQFYSSVGHWDPGNSGYAGAIASDLGQTVPTANAVLTGATQQLGQIPQPPNFSGGFEAPSLLNPVSWFTAPAKDLTTAVTDVGSSLVWGGRMLQWTMIAGFVFLFGIVLMVCALLLFGVIFFGPAVGAVKGVTALTRIAGKIGATARSEPSLPSRAPAAPGRTDALDATSTVVASGPDLRTRRAQQDEREERRRRAAQGERRRVSRTHLENARFRREGFERPSWSRPRRTFERASSAPTDAQPAKGPAGQPARRDTLRRNETPRQAADRRRKAQRKRSSR